MEPIGRSKNPILVIYLAWMVLLATAYFVLLYGNHREALPIVWGAIGLSGIAAMITGVLKHRPKVWIGWLSLIIANVLFISGDTYFKVLHYNLHQTNPFPSFADVLYLATYPLFTFGFYVFVRSHSDSKTDRGTILDAAVLTVSVSLLVLIYLVIPNVQADGTLISKLVSVAYPVGDLLVWAMLVRLIFIDSKTRSIQLLAIGAFGLINADLIYGYSQFYGFWHEGNPIDTGWIIFYTSWGAASLLSSMKAIDKPLEQSNIIRLRRLILLAAAALVAPIVLLVETARHEVVRVSTVVGIFAAVLFILVVLRMFTMVRTISQRDAEIALEKEKNEVIGLISHQLRTPISIIGMGSEMMLEEDIPQAKNVIKYGNMIKGAHNRLRELTNQLLYSSEMAMGSVTFSKQKVDLRALIVSGLDNAKTLILEKNITINDNTGEDPVVILADQKTLEATVNSLINNAARYSKFQAAIITINIENQDENIVLSVKDNGVGIPKSDQNNIFSKLFRASNAIASFPDGVGLSLYLAKQSMKYQGGEIWFESEEGTGSSFYISLPRTQV